MPSHLNKRAYTCIIFCILLLGLVLLTQGCGVKSNMMTSLSKSILNNNDLAMVESGSPAYLIMVDSLIDQDPDSPDMLSSGAQLYTTYSDVFVTDRERKRKLANKAMDYALNAVCFAQSNACDLNQKPFEQFSAVVNAIKKDELPYLFTLGNAWASWIMAHKDDFNALADIARIEAIMNRVIELDETYKDGAAYLYLGTLATFLPPAMGGKPEQGRQYFEKAISISGGKNFMAKVVYAKLYAKMMFNRQLFDRLLNEVMETDPNIDGYTLINTYAQQQAGKLLDEADDYF
ncbi:MAG: TRAP transporter TatT component family protein [Desulfobacter sp.]|uniref:TRAP transporter TatT component family protein n=1 Tax=uncultured Desulfobacter sp. TaxID=240139 RepID=UPI0029C862F4|nr:TRAP transporter TatT component family protein [uncultured Desulfobacter sp.]MCW8800453.1 TRAP transporter TatT component family protein [Desulfobacter sp.]